MIVRIEVATDPASCRAVEDLQREAWGMTDRGIVPAEQIRAIVYNGGLLLMAMHDDEAIGFCFGFVGLDDGQPILCSHMLAVRPALRSHGVGRELKLAQRRYAAERGFTKITWTFDPLQSRNAYLNLHHLRAYARRYYVDHYGPMDDEINRGLPTDRLLAVWPAVGPLDEARATPAAARWLLAAVTAGGRLRPAEPDRTAVGADAVLVAVPEDIDELRTGDPDGPAAWRVAVRGALAAAFDAGLTATDLTRGVGPGYSAYVLERLP